MKTKSFKRITVLLLAWVLIFLNISPLLSEAGNQELYREVSNSNSLASSSEPIVVDSDVDGHKDEVSSELLLSSNEDMFLNAIEMEEQDFIIENEFIISFSEQGKLKAEANKKLIFKPLLEGKVNKIADRAFTNSNVDLEYIYIDDGFVSIGKHAFQNLSITRVDINSNNIAVGDYAFADNNISVYKEMSNIKSIGAYAFYANNLSSLETSANEIGNSAFASNMLGNVRLTEVESLGEEALKGNSLSKVYIDSINPSEDLLSKNIFDLGGAIKVYIKNNINNIVSTNETDYIINPILLNVFFIDGATDGAIKESSEYYSINSFPISVELEDIENYDFISVENYMINEDGDKRTILVEKSNINDSIVEVRAKYLRKKSPSIIVSDLKRLTFPVNTAIDRDEILKNIKFYYSNGDIAPILENGELNPLITLSKDSIEASESAKEEEIIISIRDKYNDFVDKISLNYTFVVNAQVATDEIIEGKAWTYSDFKYDGNRLIGFSESGLEKLENNRNVVLPDINPYTKELIKKIAYTSQEERMYERESGFERDDFLAHQIDTLDFTKMQALEYIGVGAFANFYSSNTGISSFIGFENLINLKRIDAYAFYGLRVSELDFSNLDKLEEIASQAFYANQIESLNLSDMESLRSIELEAFSSDTVSEFRIANLPNLEVVQPSNFSKLEGEVVFENLSKLKELGGGFTGSKVEKLILKDMPNLIKLGSDEIGMGGFESNKIKEIELINIPNLEEIGARVFESNELEGINLNIPKLKKIGDSAFADNRISALDLSAYKELESLAGFNNNNLSEINLHSFPKLKEIGENAFAYNKNLVDINLVGLDLLEKIGEGAFSNIPIENLELRDLPLLKSLSGFSNTNLRKIEIDNLPKLEEIGRNAFSNIIDLEEVILRNLPELKTIKEFAFNRYDSIEDNKLGINKLVLENLPKLEEIGRNSFANNNISGELDFRSFPLLKKIDADAFSNNKITGINIQNLDNLEIINSRAFANNNIESLNISNLDALSIIGEEAFANNSIANFVLENLVSLKEISEGAFSDNKIKNIVIENFPELIAIKDRAFSSEHIKEIVIKNNPKLKYLSGFSATSSNPNARSFVTNFELSNLPELEEIGMSAFEGLLIPDVDLRDFNKLKIIGYRAFANGMLTELKLPISLENIESASFYNNPIKNINLLGNINLKNIGDLAFSSDNRNTQFVSLPVTNEPISLGYNLAKVTEEGIDFRNNENTKIKISNVRHFSVTERKKPLVLKFKNDSQIEFAPEFTRENYYADKNTVLVIIIDDITDPSKFENLPENVIINPSKVTVNYKDDKGNKLIDSKSYYAVTGTTISPPLIVNYQVRRGDVSSNYNVIRNDNNYEITLGDNRGAEGSIDFIYYDNEAIQKDEYKISVKRKWFTDREFYYNGKQLSVEAYYNLKDIDIENEKDVKLILQFPEYISDNVIFDRELPGIKLKGEPYYDTDTKQLIYTVEKFDIENTEIKIKATFEYKNIFTPDKSVDVVKAYYILSDGRTKGEPGISEEFVPRYDRWSVYKSVGDIRYKNEQPEDSKYDDFIIDYDVYIPGYHIKRELERMVITDTIPTYKKYADNADGYTIEKAIFNPDNNPGWVLSADGNTVSKEIPYEKISSYLNQEGTYYSDINNNISFEYPKAIAQYIENKAKATYYIRNPKDTEDTEFSVEDSSNRYIAPRTRYERRDHHFSKNGFEFFVPDREAVDKERHWTIYYTVGNYEDRFEKVTKPIKTRDIEIWDYDLDKDNEFLEYTSVLTSYPATLYLYDQDFNENLVTAKEAREANVAIATIELKENVRYNFTPEQIASVKSFRLDYKNLVLDSSSSSIFVDVGTKLKESKAGTTELIERTHENKAKIFFKSSAEDLGIDSLEESIGDYASKRSGGIIKNIELRKNASKNIITSRKEEFYYDLGISAYASSKDDDRVYQNFIIKDFEIVDLFPEELEILDIALSQEFREAGGSYQIFDRGGNAASIHFKAPSVSSSLQSVATIKVKPKLDSNGEASFINKAYVKHLETETQEDYQIRHINATEIEQEGGRRLSTASVNTRFQLNESLTANKYIRRSSKNGAWLKEIETLPNEEFEYKLSIYNNFESTKSNVALLDFFPAENDINSVANNIGIREARKSEFSNKYLSFIGAKWINLETNEENEYDISDFPIILIKKNDDYPKRLELGTQEEWVRKMLDNPEEYQTTNPEEAVGVYIGGADTSVLKQRSRLDLIFKMKTPDYSYDNFAEWNGKRAINNFSFTYAGSPRYAESDNVVNVLSAPRRNLVFKKIAKKETDNEEEKVLKGARYKLVQGDKEYFAVSSDEGLIYFTDILYTDYEISEVLAPQGYKLDSTKYSETLDINTYKDYENKLLEDPNYVEIVRVFEDEKAPPVKPNVFSDLVIHKTNTYLGDLANVRFKLEKIEADTVVNTVEMITDKSGNLKFSGLASGRYKLSEVNNRNRLSLIEPIIFDLPLEENFSNEEITNVSKKILDDTGNYLEYTFDILNDKYILNVLKLGIEDLTFSVKDHEAGTSGKPLANIEFDLYETTDTIVNGNRVSLTEYEEVKKGTYITNEYGKFTLTGLKVNTIYKLDELTSSTDYIEKEDVFFYIDEKGDLKTANGEAYKKKDLLVVTNKKALKTSTIEVLKVDENDNPLEGAKFRLLKLVGDSYQRLEEENVNPKKYTKYTDENGVINFADLEYGRYRLEELEAPNGYLKSNSFIDISLDPFRSKIVSKKVINKALKLNLNKVEKIAGPYANSDLAKEELERQKLIREDAIDLFVANNIIYKRLKGAEFKLKEKYADKSDIIEADIKATSSEVYSVFGFTKSINQNATYEVLETVVPVGYAKAEKNPILKIDNILSYNKTFADVYIENTKNLGSVIINKFDKDSLSVLEGAKFAIYNGHLTKEELENSNAIMTVVTGTDGVAIFENLKFGKYTVKEIESPRGFSVIEKPVFITLSKEVPNVRKSFYNNLTTSTLRIKKVDDLGNIINDLDGAEFVLYYNNGKEIHSTGEISSTENGIIEFVNVPSIGTYKIKELKAPKNYVIDGVGEYEFTRDKTNPLSNDEIAYSIVNKEQIEIRATKKWEGGNEETRPNVFFKLYREFEKDGHKVEESLDTAIVEIGKLNKEVIFEGKFDKYYSDLGSVKEYRYFVKEVDESSKDLDLSIYGYESYDKGLDITNKFIGTEIDTNPNKKIPNKDTNKKEIAPSLLPKTSDNSNILLYIYLILMSSVILGLAILKKYRK